MMEKLLQNLLTADLHGSIVILAVLLLRAVLRKTPKKYICFLWMLAGLRLLLPVPLVSSHADCRSTMWVYSPFRAYSSAGLPCSATMPPDSTTT